MKRLILAAALIVTAPLFAQDGAAPAPPAIKITGPGSVRPGRLCKLHCETAGKSVVWVVCPPGIADIDPSETGKTLSFVSIQPGTYQAWALTSVGDVMGKATYTLTVSGNAPVPPGPSPTPVPPGPQPNPTPTPQPAQRLFIMVIEETAAPFPNRGAFITDAALLARVQGKGHTLRFIDKDEKGPDNKTPANLLPYMAKLTGQKLPQVFIVKAAGGLLYQADLPATPAELVALLTQYGG